MVGIRFRAAYEYEAKDHYIKPYVDLDLMHMSAPGYTESGGSLALRANSSQQFSAAITPMLEFGANIVNDANRKVTAYASLGASFLLNNKVSTQFSFANVMANTGNFDVITDGPTVLGRLNLGIQAYESTNIEVRAQYGLQFGGGYVSQSLGLNMLYRF